MYERAVESYGRYYHIAWPNHEADAGRGARRSPLYATLANAGAVYGNKFGWERPSWFAAPGTPAIETPSFERGPAFDAIGAEHRAVRERVALIDMTSFSKYEVRGPGRAGVAAEACRQRSRPARRHHRLHAALQRARRNRSGRDDHAAWPTDRFYFVTGSALGVRDRSTIERHLPADGSVEIVEQTSAKAVLNLCGPRARDVLAAAHRRAARQRELSVHERARASTSPMRLCSRCASRISASWATNCTSRSNTRCICTSDYGAPASGTGSPTPATG